MSVLDIKNLRSAAVRGDAPGAPPPQPRIRLCTLTYNAFIHCVNLTRGES